MFGDSNYNSKVVSCCKKNLDCVVISSRCLFFWDFFHKASLFGGKDTSHPQNRMMTGASATVLFIFPDLEHLPMICGIPQVKQMEGLEQGYQRGELM